MDINYVELHQPDRLLMIESLDYSNPYDFTKMHRHDYFEIIFVNEGNGSQLIDFTSYTISGGQIYVIYPGQIHLMHRNTANGLVLQFRKNIFEHIRPINHYNLYNSTALVSLEVKPFQHLYCLAECIKELMTVEASANSLTKYKAYSYLQIILLSLVELNTGKADSREHNLLNEYLALTTTHIKTNKKVAEYAAMLNCSPDKLNYTCKKSLGKSALEIIHEELLLEIRRLLLLNEMSLKEIAFELNFDSQSNFSGFIKSHTGMTPTELQTAVSDIYK
jgi:AraC-like DNA-binding protein